MRTPSPPPAEGARPAPGPIFVVGTMRSGSTLLRLVLDSHPAIAIGGETSFLVAASAAKAIPGFKYGREWYARVGWSEPELDERLREMFGGMFRRHAESQGKSRWGEKTPAHTWHMALGAQLFPDAVFVGIVRHPGAVAVSLRKRFHYSWEGAIAHWVDTNTQMVREASSLGDRFVLCRYEDVVGSPREVVGELLGWLGEPWAEDVLHHAQVQRDKGAPRLVDGATSSREPIDGSRATRWLDEVSPEELRVLDERAGPLAGFFGYDAERPEAPAGAHEWPGDGRGGALTTGSALARRRTEWASRVDFAPRPEPVGPDASVEDLGRRVRQAEEALARMRARPVVRLSDALRRAQRGRSLGDLRAVVHTLRGTARG